MVILLWRFEAATVNGLVVLRLELLLAEVANMFDRTEDISKSLEPLV